MKWFFASDLHGNAEKCALLLAHFEEEKADKLILLGDLLYHGPRNPLPNSYAPADVATQLNAYKEKIFCVRGNCDSEVDQMVLTFPMMEKSGLLYDGKRLFFLNHGHNLPQTLPEGAIVVTGHTHVAVLDMESKIPRLNPGSVGLPKDGTKGTYAVLSEEEIRICDIQSGNTLFKSSL